MKNRSLLYHKIFVQLIHIGCYFLLSFSNVHNCVFALQNFLNTSILNMIIKMGIYVVIQELSSV